MNKLKIPVVIILVLLLSGCTWGSLVIKHKYGRLPKIYVETPVEDLKFRVYKFDYVILQIKKKFP